MRSSFVKIALTIGLVTILGGCSMFSAPSKNMVGLKAPATRVTMLDGSGVPLSAYQGKTTTLVFWAAWCKRSPRVLQDINAYARQFKGRTDLAFLALSVDKAEDTEKVKEKIDMAQLENFEQAFSGNEAYDETYLAFDEHTLPAVYVIGADGTILARGENVEVVKQFVK